jgi:hypothetical protein
MQIHAVAVDLPDLDLCPVQRSAARIEDAAGQPGDHSGGLRISIVDAHQVVVGVEWQTIRIEGPGGLSRGWGPWRSKGFAARQPSQPRPQDPTSAAVARVIQDRT